MEIAKIVYNGELRNTATHLKSGQTIITDAPVDNQGKGEAFSPTDLLSTSLGVCMTTIMGITARAHNIPLKGMEVSIEKYMGTDPRRVVKIGVKLTILADNLSDKHRKLLETAGLNCPVAKSLSAELVQDIQFIYKNEND